LISWRRADFAATKNIEEFLVIAATQCIVLLAIVVLFKIGLKPLAELKIIKIASLNQLRNVNVAFDAIFVEGHLKNFVVVDILVLVLGVPLDALEWECAWVKRIKHCAVDGSSCALLDLR